MARPMRLAAPVTKAVLVKSAEIDDVQDTHEHDKGGENGDGDHDKTPTGYKPSRISDNASRLGKGDRPPELMRGAMRRLSSRNAILGGHANDRLI